MKLSVLFKTSSFISLVFVSVSALSYEPQNVHKILTAKALSNFQQCYPNDFTYEAEKIRQRIIQGNIAMDEGLEAGIAERLRLQEDDNLSPTKRIYNWHFYNQRQSHLSEVGLIDQSMNGLWLGVQRGLENNQNTDDKALFVGALLHLLEDVSVPAHIVPVYHGPVAVKALGPNQLAPLVQYMLDAGKVSYLKGDSGVRVIKDAVDGSLPEKQRLSSDMASAAFCGELKVLPEDPASLRAWLSEATLTLLAKKIQACKSITWQHFWIPPQGNSYFGRYNIGMNQPVFGESGRLISGSDYCDLVEDDQRYKDFVFQLHRSAIQADIVLLRWASQQRLH